ncbi:MAG: hypothetical protein EKK55_16280 [Rhodocyclaceae bacterium]|nr:MAG: hypothetical protein EKK55_16280 [Rhodocyclaceae bacterium]
MDAITCARRVRALLESALCALKAMRERMEAGEAISQAEYYARRAAVMTRAATCARAGLADRAVAARDVVDALPARPAPPDARHNPHVCGSSNCLLRAEGAPRGVGVGLCRCLDSQLPAEEQARVRAGIRWLAKWAGRGLAAEVKP